MFKETEIEEIIDKKVFYIDLRSVSEFNESHIEGAINLPILNDEERIIVGTLYDRGFTTEAKKKGVEFASYKLSYYVNEIITLREKKEVVLYCSRGGFRSTVLFNLLKSLKIQVMKLKGGYKSYRKYVRNYLENEIEKIDFVTLDGLTGSGKTEILEELEKNNVDVLDLERLANHRGSVLGSVLKEEQPSQKTFENRIFETLRKRKKDIVFVEAESIRVGKLNVPKELFVKYQNGKRILINSNMEDRIKRLKKEYVKENDEELIAAIENLRGLVKEERIEKYKLEIKNGEYEKVIEDLIKRYYDPKYKTSSKKYIETITSEDKIKTARYLKRSYYD